MIDYKQVLLKYTKLDAIHIATARKGWQTYTVHCSIIDGMSTCKDIVVFLCDACYGLPKKSINGDDKKFILDHVNNRLGYFMRYKGYDLWYCPRCDAYMGCSYNQQSILLIDSKDDLRRLVNEIRHLDSATNQRKAILASIIRFAMIDEVAQRILKILIPNLPIELL